MYCALRRTCSNAQKVEDRKNKFPSSKLLEENNFRASSNDSEVSSLAWRNHRGAIFTLFALEPNGHWRIVTLPLQSSDHTIHLGYGSQVKMDGLHLVSSSLVSSVRVDQQKARRGPTTDRSSSVKSFMPIPRSFSGSKFLYQPRNKGLPNRLSRLNALAGNSSCQDSFNSSNSSVVLPTNSNATKSSDIHNAVSKVGKAEKRNPKKKSRKKGNQNKKQLSCETGSTELEYLCGSSTSETGVSKNADYGIRPFPFVTTLAVSSPGSIGNDSGSDGNSCRSNINYYETQKLCTSYVDDLDVLEASFISEQLLSDDTENGVQTVLPESSLSCGVQDTHSKPPRCLCDPCSTVFSDETNDSCSLDFISVCSFDDGSINAAGYKKVQLSTVDTGAMYLSEPAAGYVSRKGCFSLENMLNGTQESCCPPAEATTSAGGDDMATRGKQIKQVPRRSSGAGKFYDCTGKENNHSIWQKVQRTVTDDECSSSRLRIVKSARAGAAGGSKEVPLLKKNNNVGVAQSSLLSTYENKSQSKIKASKRLKRKTTLEFNQELNYYSRKGYYATKARLKTNMQQNEVLDIIPPQLGGQKGLNSVSGSRSKIGCPRVGIGFQTNSKIESITSKPVCSLEGRPNELQPLERVCATLCNVTDQIDERESSSPTGFCDHQDQTELLLNNGQSDYLLPPGGEEQSIKIDKDASPVEEQSNHDHIFEKWTPVGTKLDSLGSSNSLYIDNPNRSAGGKSWTQENTGKKMASDLEIFASSLNTKITYTGQYSCDDNDLQDEVRVEKYISQRTCTRNESRVNGTAAKCLSCYPEARNNSHFEKDSSKIARAVNDAYRAQLASETVQIATGCPIAEFERLLFSASPVISPPCNILNCKICLPDQAVGVPLCRHETHNISLGSLWQWYEKHGTYGLEVKAEDYESSKRMGIDRIAFRAYFVPFLSAVQLFRNRKSTPPPDSCSGAPGTEPTQAGMFAERPGNSSNVSCLPIFSVLFPQPHVEGTNSVSPRNCVCLKTSSVCIEGNETIQSDNSTTSDDLELLFEYFEVEPPQQRRPLFEMYSVAWYPIYRIPDDNFRAAFLTYHSLGHLVRRTDSFGVGACVISPVVGLQSYNAQGECWFQLRQSASIQSREIPTSKNHSGILKERLKTLEHTASLMARAVVTKGNLTSVNTQPDYEFFLSRRRSPS